MSTTSAERVRILWSALLALALSAPGASAVVRARPARPGAAAAAKPPVTARASRAAAADSALTLKGGDEGTVFRSLTIEGEDRIHVRIERPPLAFDVDPATAPGLQGTTTREVLDRTRPDGLAPLFAMSARETSPHEGRPWLDRFASEGVARFHPAVKGATAWKLSVTDAGGQSVMAWQGTGDPPAEIVWDGRGANGDPVTPGLTYSYVLEARDRAGNRRNFVGQGFQVGAYRYGGDDHPLLVFAGRELGGPELNVPQSAAATPLIVLEAVSWLDRSRHGSDVIRVTGTARTLAQAQALADRVSSAIAARAIGDPGAVQAVANAQPGAPEDGAIRIELTKSP
jgi:hypothetical protein